MSEREPAAHQGGETLPSCVSNRLARNDAVALVPPSTHRPPTINPFAPRQQGDVAGWTQRFSSGSLFGTPSHLSASSIDGILLVSTGHSFASSALIDM